MAQSNTPAIVACAGRQNASIHVLLSLPQARPSHRRERLIRRLRCAGAAALWLSAALFAAGCGGSKRADDPNDPDRSHGQSDPHGAVITPPNAPAADADDAAPATQPTAEDKLAYAKLAAVLGKGEIRGRTFAIHLPRTDLRVSIEMGDFPVEAGLASEFNFWQCTCGKTQVAGQFCLQDFEVNDVIDLLREGRFTIVSTAAMLMNDHPRIMLLRFQGEGQPEEVAGTLQKALGQVGPNRMKKLPVN